MLLIAVCVVRYFERNHSDARRDNVLDAEDGDFGAMPRLAPVLLPPLLFKDNHFCILCLLLAYCGDVRVSEVPEEKIFIKL